MTTCLVYNQCVLVSGAGVSALCSVCVQSLGGPLFPGFVLCALYLCSGVITSVVVFFLFLHCIRPVFCSVLICFCLCRVMCFSSSLVWSSLLLSLSLSLSSNKIIICFLFCSGGGGSATHIGIVMFVSCGVSFAYRRGL